MTPGREEKRDILTKQSGKYRLTCWSEYRVRSGHPHHGHSFGPQASSFKQELEEVGDEISAPRMGGCKKSEMF